MMVPWNKMPRYREIFLLMSATIFSRSLGSAILRFRPKFWLSTTVCLELVCARKLLISWNVNLKQIWQLPHETQGYFFEHLTTGSNIRKIENEAGITLGHEDIKHKIDTICDKINFAEVPEGQMWRINSARELSLLKSRNLLMEGLPLIKLKNLCSINDTPQLLIYFTLYSSVHFWVVEFIIFFYLDACNILLS